KADRVFKKYSPDYVEAALKTLFDVTDQAVIDGTTLTVIKQAERLTEDIKTVASSEAIKPEDMTRLNNALANIRKRQGDWVHHGSVIKRMEALARIPSADSVREAQRLIKEAEARLPDFGREREVAG